MTIQIKSDPSDEDCVIELSGDFNGSVGFIEVNPRLSQRLILDCDKVGFIDSMAAQNWSAWLKSFDSRQQFCFRHVRPNLIRLFNSIFEYLPSETTVESFYVPYACERCESEEAILVRRGKEYVEGVGESLPKLLLPEEINCMSCKDGGMKLAVVESQYLRFLSSQKEKPQQEKSQKDSQQEKSQKENKSLKNEK